MTNAEESAFPEVQENPQFNFHSYGLTKREYFAAMFMQGCIASGFQTTMDKHAEYSIEAADALINALNQTK
jgi:hypothetical protein